MDLPVDPSTLSHDNRAHVLVSVVVGLLGITTLTVGLRFYTRLCLLKQVGVDDYLSLLALVSPLLSFACESRRLLIKVLAIATGISQCISK
jgi:hypothetical protein